MTKTARTLGPVKDLESHLPDRWWETLFGALYLKTDGDVVENDVNTAREVDLLIERTALKPSTRVPGSLLRPGQALDRARPPGLLPHLRARPG